MYQHILLCKTFPLLMTILEHLYQSLHFALDKNIFFIAGLFQFIFYISNADKPFRQLFLWCFKKLLLGCAYLIAAVSDITFYLLFSLISSAFSLIQIPLVPFYYLSIFLMSVYINMCGLYICGWSLFGLAYYYAQHHGFHKLLYCIYTDPTLHKAFKIAIFLFATMAIAHHLRACLLGDKKIVPQWIVTRLAHFWVKKIKTIQLKKKRRKRTTLKLLTYQPRMKIFPKNKSLK